MNLILPRTFIAVCILLYSFQTYAQQAFAPGYIIKGTDTIRGFLKKDVESNLLTGVVYSENANGIPNQFYSPKQIMAFYFNGENSFQLVSFTDVDKTIQQYFVKYLLKGYFNLYSFRKKELQYFLVIRNDSSYLLYDDKYLNSGALDEAGNFRNQLFPLSIGCNTVSGELNNLPYSEKNIIDYIRRLNLCKEPESASSILYVQEKSKVNFYVYAGGLPLGKKWEYTGRAIARFTLPSVSKHLSVNTGLSYMYERTTVETNQVKQKRNISTASAGVTVQNNFTSGIIQPYLEAGVGVGYKKDDEPTVISAGKGQSDYGVVFIVAIGVEAFINKQIAIKADWRYELLMHYPTIGIAFFFK